MTEYPAPVVESVWRKINNPSRNTLSKIRDRYGNPLKKQVEELDPHIHEIQRNMSRLKLSAILDDLIEFGRGYQAATAGFGPMSKKLFNQYTRLGLINVPSRGSRMQSLLSNTLRTRRSAIRIERHGPLTAHGTAAHARIEDEGYIKKLLDPDYPRLSAKLDDLINFEDPRPRNKLGEFSGQEEGGPDPNAMYKTYQVARKGGTFLGAGVAGGVAGAAGGQLYRELIDKLKKIKK